MADQKIKIMDLAADTPVDSDYIPYVDVSDTTQSADGTTKRALKSDLKGDQGDAATVDAGTTTTGAPGTNASVVNSGTTSAAIFDFTIPRGDTGATGPTGPQGPDGQVQTVVGGTNVSVDATDPANPIVNSDVTDITLPTSDNVTNNASISKHGFLPKLSGNSTQYLDGQGNYSTPAGVVNSYTTQSFTSQTTVVVNHGFGAFPLIQILGTSNEELIPESITHNSINQFTVVFTVSTTGTVIASVGSPQAANVTTAPGNYTVQTGDNIIKCTGLGSTITLPTAVGIAGIEFKIDNDTIGDIFIVPTGAETIQDEVIQTLPTQSSATFYSDGTNWRIT